MKGIKLPLAEFNYKEFEPKSKREIGAGTFGKVYEMEFCGKKMAIKVPHVPEWIHRDSAEVRSLTDEERLRVKSTGVPCQCS